MADFFSFERAQELRRRHGPAAFVTSHNALAHVDRLDDVVRGVHHWLEDDGVFVLEVGYFVDVFQKLRNARQFTGRTVTTARYCTESRLPEKGVSPHSA